MLRKHAPRDALLWSAGHSKQGFEGGEASTMARKHVKTPPKRRPGHSWASASLALTFLRPLSRGIKTRQEASPKDNSRTWRPSSGKGESAEKCASTHFAGAAGLHLRSVHVNERQSSRKGVGTEGGARFLARSRRWRKAPASGGGDHYPHPQAECRKEAASEPSSALIARTGR